MMESPFSAIPEWFYKDLISMGLGTVSWFGVFHQRPKAARWKIPGDYWMLLVVQEGKLDVGHGDEQVSVEAMQALIIPPAVQFWERTCTESVVAWLPLKTQVELPGIPHPLSRIPSWRVMPLANPDQVHDILNRIEAMPKSAEKKGVGHSLEGQVLVPAVLYYALSGGFAAGVFEEEAGDSRKWVLQCRTELQHEFRNPDFRISELAQRVGKSRSEVQRRFQQEFGISPKDWLHRFRIKLAVQFLRSHPHLTVESIMQRCGYRSRSLFYKMFTRFEGCSPASIRHPESSGPQIRGL